MFFAKQETVRKQTRRPDKIGPLENGIGIAIWSNSDGNHDLKVGPSVTIPNGSMIVKTCFKLSELRAVVSGLAAAASAFGNDQTVPSIIRQDLQLLAKQLDSALAVSVADELNGEASRYGSNVLPFGASA